MTNTKSSTFFYSALTIGPIYKTMSQARKSRHLWGASYLFSFIMKKLLIHLLNETKINANDILLPHALLTELQANNDTGTGLYPDRLFIKNEKKAIDASILAFQRKIIDLFISYTGIQYKDFFENYFRIYAVSYELPIATESNLSNNINDYSNIIWVGNKLLDSLELKEKYYPDITRIVWSEIIDKLNGKLLYKDAFNKNIQNYQFPSVIEIATDDFRQRNESEYEKLVNEFLRDKDETTDNQNSFLDALSANAALFKGLTVHPYHKYMVVVQADGDNIGKTIAAVGKNESEINTFSKALFEFAKKAAEAINNYGGKPVYVGGDDLFFFAPVAVQQNNPDSQMQYLITIFDLIRNLDTIFKESIIDHDILKALYEKGITKPSLSYGVSVVYSKFPLNEAREIAYNLLQEAKKMEDDKNKICFKVLRHSGQGFGFTVDKKKFSDLFAEPHSYNYFLNLCTRIPEDAGLLTSVIFNLAPLHATLNSIGGNKKRMTAFFDNMFNEPHHQIPDIKTFLENTANFIHQLYIDFPNDLKGMPKYESEERNSNLAKIYSTLRFLKMLVANE